MNEMCRASSTTTTIFCPSKNKRSKSIQADFFPLKFVFYNDENGSHDTYRFVHATVILLCAIFFSYLLWALLLMLVCFFCLFLIFFFFSNGIHRYCTWLMLIAQFWLPILLRLQLVILVLLLLLLPVLFKF